MTLTDEIRTACAWVAQRARQVRIVERELDAYADSLPRRQIMLTSMTSPARPLASGQPHGGSVPAVQGDALAVQRDALAARWLTLDAINFGSGYFPTLHKHDQLTGYRTIAAGIARRCDGTGPWTADELTQIDAAALADLFGQDRDHPLMALFAASLRDLGGHLRADFGGSFSTLVDHAGASAVALVTTLAGWDCFADVSQYDGREIPFYKRAQIAAADLHRAGVAQFTELGQLTLFADNLVPHVLRLDGVLAFDPALVARIEAGELIEHGSPEEVEIRACALTAVEQLVAVLKPPITAAALDEYLWNRGQSPSYKAFPRHRSRCTAY